MMNWHNQHSGRSENLSRESLH